MNIEELRRLYNNLGEIGEHAQLDGVKEGCETAFRITISNFGRFTSNTAVIFLSVARITSTKQ